VCSDGEERHDVAFSVWPALTPANGFDPDFEFNAGAAKAGNKKASAKWAFLHSRKLKVRAVIGFLYFRVIWHQQY
jgi:hypothetical protein